MSPLMLVNYRLVEPKGQSVVWTTDVTSIKGRLHASRKLAQRMGYPTLSILDCERSNEYLVARKDKIVARLFPLPRWS